jgi:hypothetical protein
MENDMRPMQIGRFTDTPSYEELQRQIERLRLTDEEREAVADAADRYAGMTPESAETAAVLRGLLKRL